MPKGIPLTDEEQLRRRKQIFTASVHLFLEKGFNETSIREIAVAAGIGKSTLYDYYKSKDEILVSYFANEIVVITSTPRRSSRATRPSVRSCARSCRCTWAIWWTTSRSSSSSVSKPSACRWRAKIKSSSTATPTRICCAS